MSRRAAESVAANAVALGLRLLRGLRIRLGNVRDAFVRSARPFAAMKVALVFCVEVIVRKRIPGAKRRVIIPNAGNKIIIGINVV